MARGAALALGASCWLPRAASAAELALDEPAACTTLDELSFRVERLLGQPLDAAEPMRVSVHTEAQPAGYGARLEVARSGVVDRGVRSLHAASCDELTESLAIAIVVAIGGAGEPPETAPVSAPSAVVVEPVASSIDAVEPEPADTASTGPSLAASAWVLGDTGTLPAAGLGVGVGVGVAWPSVELRALGTLLPEREGNVNGSDPGSPGASIGLLAGAALACVPAIHQPALALAACAGWELGRLSGNGTHVSIPYHHGTLWSAARIDLAGRWSLPHTALSLELLVTAAAPFTRDDFVLKDIGSVHRPASVVGRLGLGLNVAID